MNDVERTNLIFYVFQEDGPSGIGSSCEQIIDFIHKSLLGGLVVRVGSRMIDSSLKTQLQKMRLAMKGIG